MASKSSVPAAALALPADQRLALGYALLDSVENADGCTPAEWEAAWGAECERRLAELTAHPERAVPWDEVMARALKKQKT